MEITQIPTTHLVPRTFNAHSQLRDIDELAATIAYLGILQPLIVVPIESEDGVGRYMINAGHRRHAAATQLELETVPCIVARDRDEAEELYGLTVTPAQADWFVDQFLPVPTGAVSERERDNVWAARDKLRVLAMEKTNADIAHTVYGLVQIGTEYLDHVRPWRTSASHFTRTMVTVDRHKHRLVGLARKAATAAV